MVGLAKQGAWPEPFREEGYLATILREPRGAEEVRLAVLALGYGGDTNAIRLLIPLLTEPLDYAVHAHVCVALARLGAVEAVPVLEERLRAREFHALPEAFRALVTLGDREAVPLAIARIEPEIRESNSGFVVNELREVTGQQLGWEQEPWRRWWEQAHSTWRIPPESQQSWDRQGIFIPPRSRAGTER